MEHASGAHAQVAGSSGRRPGRRRPALSGTLFSRSGVSRRGAAGLAEHDDVHRSLSNEEADLRGRHARGARAGCQKAGARASRALGCSPTGEELAALAQFRPDKRCPGPQPIPKFGLRVWQPPDRREEAGQAENRGPRLRGAAVHASNQRNQLHQENSDESPNATKPAR